MILFLLVTNQITRNTKLINRILLEFHIRPPLLGCVEQQRGLPLPCPCSKWKQLNGVSIILGRKVRKKTIADVVFLASVVGGGISVAASVLLPPPPPLLFLLLLLLFWCSCCKQRKAEESLHDIGVGLLSPPPPSVLLQQQQQQH